MKKLLSVLLFNFIMVSIFAQIDNGKTPYSFRNTIPSSTSPNARITSGTASNNTMTLSSINLSALQAEDAQDALNGVPPRFGYPHNVNFNLTNSGVWQTLANGDRIWTLEIYSPSAKSINLLYNRFWLPQNAEFYIYNSAKTHSIGGFTSRNNKGTRANPKRFGTGLVFGDRVILEYYEPQNVRGQGIISIAKVVHGYRYISIMQGQSESVLGFGKSGSCQVNVNCPEGNNWQKEKTSVALILVEGMRWCTGSLINNTKNDGALYFLTANHCINDRRLSRRLDALADTDGSDWSFYWNYESTNCSNGMDFVPPSTSGATLVSNNGATDFALFKLTESPYDLKPAVQTYFNGWERNSPNGATVGIHHPKGDIKKICLENNAVTSTPYLSPRINNSALHWRVANWDVGVTEGGSSGSPLFNLNHRIVGHLRGGGAECVGSTDNGSSDWYGKFGVSWNNSTDRRRRLKDWLDPISSNAMFLDGRYSQPTLVGPEIVCTPKVTHEVPLPTLAPTALYVLEDAPPATKVTWSVSSNIKIVSLRNTEIVIKYKSRATGASGHIIATWTESAKTMTKRKNIRFIFSKGIVLTDDYFVYNHNGQIKYRYHIFSLPRGRSNTTYYPTIPGMYYTKSGGNLSVKTPRGYSGPIIISTLAPTVCGNGFHLLEHEVIGPSLPPPPPPPRDHELIKKFLQPSPY